jgi:chromosome partitioning protein
MRTVAVANQKGGSGKTTTAVNLAAALGEQGHRVLLIDLDPQASASQWFSVQDDGRGLLDVFTRNTSLSSLTRNTSVEGVDVVPGSPWLANVETVLAGEVGRETLLRHAIASLPPRWAFVLCDCPPSLGLLSLSAFVACSEVFVPVEARTMALSGLAALWHTVERVQERLNPELRVSGLLACRVDVRTNLSRDVVTRLRERFGPLVFNTVIHENVRLAEAPSFAPITVYAPASSGAADYRAAAAEFVARGRKPAVKRS